MTTQELLQVELDRGFSKTELEKLIGLPTNFLSGYLKGKKRLSKKCTVKVSNFLSSESKLDPLNIGFIGLIPSLKKRAPIFYESAKSEDINEISNSEIQNQIDAVNSESKPHLISRENFEKYKRKKISQLQQQLK